VDLRTRTALFCAALALAIAASVLLRGRVRQVHLLFAAFTVDVGLWYLTQALFGFSKSMAWERATGLLAVLMPQLAVRLFLSIVPRRPVVLVTESGSLPPPTARDAPPHPLVRIATLLAIPMTALVLSPYHRHEWVRALLFVYVAGLTGAALLGLDAAGRASDSRAVRARVRFLVVVGAFAATFSLADFLWWVGARLPPVGAVLSIVFLFALAQSLQSARLLDLYDLVGRLLVATALSFCIAAIFWVFVTVVGRFNTMYLNAVLASIAVLILFNPLQALVEERTHQLFFRERHDLERAVNDLRRRLAHVLDTREMVEIVLAGLEQSRRVTSAAIYLRNPTAEAGGEALLLEGQIGAAGRALRLEEPENRVLLDRLGRGAFSLEEVERELSDALDADDSTVAASARELHGRLGDLGAGLASPIRADDGELVGILVVQDDRVRDAFSPEEQQLFERLAAQLAMVVENSRAYARVKERDRLAALGAMAAGIAHEIKNPLGAIKGAAQLLENNEGEASGADPEFVGIILEEVDRLDRVVSSILDYARQRSPEVEPMDVNGAVRRTMQILSPTYEDTDVTVALAEDLPPARIDPEQLRQVLMNLVSNAVQAMGGRGRVSVVTSFRPVARATWAANAEHGLVEVRVADTGPGIASNILKNLFVPFFTTKAAGTGLGLAISQRIVQNAGGTIEVNSAPGVGTTFTILLPAAVTKSSAPAAAE